VVPPIASGFDAEVQQLTVSEYRNPAQLPHGAVLIVGDGASGRDIAADLVSTRKVYLAGGRPRRLLPEKLFSQSIWSWLDRLGLMRAGPDSLVGRIIRRSDPFPDRNRSNRALTGMGIALTGRLVSATGKKATFSDGSSHEVETVIWAAGYKDESQWIDIPAARDLQGNITQNGGISSVPGLHFLGRPWQRNRASALIMGAGEDAKVVTQAIIHSTRGSRTEIKLQQGTRSIAVL
jgi:putative flavoprotein involved in K+ transport